MFTWICPQCGREVPPSYTECPDCAQKAAAAPPPPQQPTAPPPGYPPPQGPPPQYYPPQGQPPQTQQYYQPPAQQPPQQQPYYPPPPQQQYPPPPPPPQQYAPPPQQHYAPPPTQQQQYAPPPPPPPQSQQPQYAPPPVPGFYPKSDEPAQAFRLPVWLMTILFAAGIGAVVGGIYWLMQGGKGSAGSGPAPTAAVESPAAKPGAKTNPLQKYIEIAGVRFTEDAKKKIMVRFIVVNHSDADINGLAGNVTIWGRTQKSEEDAQGTFSFSTNVGPGESKDLTVPLTSKFKIYELPDWQNVTTDVQITAPAGGA